MSADAAVIEPPPPPRTPARRRWFIRVLILLAALAVVIVGAVAWLLDTQGGARFVLGQITRAAGEGVRYEGVEGTLGGPMRIKLIEVSRPDMYARVEDFEMHTSPFAPLRGRLLIHNLSARLVEVRTASTGAAARVPVSFAPPYPLRLEEGRIGELRLGALSPEARAETDPQRKRALMDASRAGDLVVKDIYLRGEGDERRWKIDEAHAGTAFGSGRVAGTLETASPFALDARADFEGIVAERPYKAAVAAKGTLKSLEAKLDGELSGQKATGRLVLEPFASVPVRTLELQARDVDLSKHAAGPATRLGVEVRLTAEAQAFAGPVRLENADPGPWDRQKLPFSSASARVVVTRERVDVADMSIVLLGGGSAMGRAIVQKRGVQADLRIADVDLSALHGGLQKTRVTGRVAVEGDAAAQRFQVALRDPRFDIEGRAGLAQQRLGVETVRIRTGAGAVTAQGELALAGKKEFRFEGRAEHFDPSAFVKGQKGDLNFAFATRGALVDGIAGEAKLDIAPSTYAGLPASGRATVAGDKSRIASADVDVTLGEARLVAKGSFGRTGDAMDVNFRIPNLSVVAKPFGIALAGRAEGEGRLVGTFQSPAGRIALTGANLALPSNVFVRELVARAEAGVEPDSPIDANVQAKGVAIGADNAPTPLAESAAVTLKGTRVAHRLELSAQMARQTGVRAVLAGGLDPRARALAWNGRIESLAMTGRGAFTLTAPTTLSASADAVELGDAELKGEWGEARLMVTRWTPRTLHIKGSSPGIQIQNLARSLRLEAVPRSNLVLAGEWDVRAAETFEGTLDVRRVSGDLRVGDPAIALGLREITLKAEAVRGRARADIVLSGERIGRIHGEGAGQIVHGETGWVFAANAPVQARLVAEQTNLEQFAPWLGVDARLSGRVNADVSVTGTGADPRVSGTARAEGLAVREPATGFEIEGGLLAIKLTGKSVAIEQFTATAPWRVSEAARERIAAVTPPPDGGKLSAEGGLDLGTRRGSIRIKVDRVPVTQTPRRFLALSGEARLEATAEGILAAGALKADAGWIGALAAPLPSVSEDVIVVRASKPAAVEEDAPAKDPIRIDARLALGDHLYFQGRGLDTRLAGEVHITGTPGPGLRANGIIRTVGGTYDGYGQKLAIERGVLTFGGSVDNPQLNVLALRKGLPVEAGVEVLGTTTRPRVRLVSSPDVPEPEKLSWLVLGRGASDASLGDSAVMMAAARALLGNNNPGSDLTKRLGFDEIRIGRSDTNSVLGVLPQSTVAGRTGTASAADVVSVGRRLNDRLHLTYEQGLSDAEGALRLTWRISQQFQVLARAGYLPGLDAVYRWTFQ
ncbi:MAG TPA: translocation/assembly module TamB domain-containing protein [Usitatibacter sp.]|nr:translocation/assembly module TamB domain-containing protein [Usitatibacter sp.]